MISKEMRSFRTTNKYKVESLDILFNDGSISKIEPGMVTHLYIEKDYDNLYFPIVNISMTMDDEIYDRINRETDTVKFRLKVIMNEYTSNKSISKYTQVINDVFICFLNKQVVISDKKLYNSRKKAEQGSSAGDRVNNRSFYLFKDDVIKCKKIHNLTIQDAALSDLVLYLFQISKIDKLLMSKLDNQGRVSNLTIPSGNLIENFKFLDTIKGFYKRGLLLFFDIDTAYFIDMSSKSTSWRKNEVRMTHMHVANMEATDSELTGNYIDSERKSTHIFSNTNDINISNENLINDQLIGNDITIVNNKTGNISRVNEKTTQIGDSNKVVVNSIEDNQYTIESMRYRMKEKETIIEIVFREIDFMSLTPNKEFLITFEDSSLNKNYGGNYRICKSISMLRKDGEELKGEFSCVMKKQ